MKSNYFSILKAFALCFGFFSILTSCKENVIIDTDLIPDVDNIHTFEKNADELDLQMSVHIEDTLITGDANFPLVGIGSLYNDPFYGHTDAGAYFQVSLPSVDYEFPDSIATLDSSFLIIPYSGVVFGDSNSLSNFNVYEITDPNFGLDTSSRQFYSFDEYLYNTTEIGSISVGMKLLKTDTLGYKSGDTFINHLKIPLSSVFANKIFSLPNSSLRNNGAFVQAFRGFYVKSPESLLPSAKRGIHYFLLDPANTSSNYGRARMELHYTFENGKSGITLFPFNRTASAFFTNVKRNYSGFPASSFSEGTATNEVLIQGMPGYQTDITINNLNTIPRSAINMARLEINVPKSAGIYLPPQLLLVKGVDSAGATYEIADYQYSTASGLSAAELANMAKAFVGGEPKLKVIDGQEYYQYQLNIPREIQNAITNGKNFVKLRIFAQTNYPGGFRIVAPGKDAAGNEKLKFTVIYTKL